MVLRDAAGLVVDSLNYGGLVDPWASEGYHATSGAGQSGCSVPAPGAGRGGFGGPGGPAAGGPNRSSGRFPDGLDTDSNCTDFLLQTATTLSAASAAGANNVKVASVADFGAGQTILIDTGASLETAVIATVGSGANLETAVVAATTGGGRGVRDGGPGGATITVTAPVKSAHAAGAQVSGSGITFTAALTRAHDSGAQVAGSVPTPGAPNKYSRRGR
jgi:hypothetical protein